MKVNLLPVIQKCRAVQQREAGQTMVEFAIIGLILMMLTAGLVDVGRAFFQYNAVSAAARYGARWGSVVGGTCALPYAMSKTDFCNQLSSGSGNFWAQAGNAPLQGNGVACPSYDSAPGDYYTVSDYSGTSATTIVGAIAQHFDSNDQSSNFVVGALTPGLDLSKVKVCIQVSNTVSTPAAGDTVSVVIKTPFYPLTGLLPNGQVAIRATSQYEVE